MSINGGDAGQGATVYDDIRKNQLAYLQLMTNDLSNKFATGLDPTKCLNTAVLLMYLTAGQRGLDKAFHCNVDKVSDRYATAFSSAALSDFHLSNVRMGLLGSRFSGRKVHYIMLTNTLMPPISPSSSSVENWGTAELQNNKNPSEGVMFPGHVFIVERAGPDAWHLYQSYINQYDFDTQVTQYSESKSTARNREFVERFCVDLSYFAKADVWDERCAAFWKFLTHVDAERFVGHKKNGVLLCHQALSSERSLSTFLKYVAVKRAFFKTIGTDKDNEIYGDVALYAKGMERGVRPLTVGEMRKVLSPE